MYKYKYSERNGIPNLVSNHALVRNDPFQY
jgi:hypothetical protein